jgi:holin-like protein
MLAAITVLLVFQLIGEIAVIAFGLPVPGPVVGMALLFVSLIVRGSVTEELASTANGLLRHLSLLFVPAGVGVMAHLNRLASEWLPITVSLVFSTLLTIAVTAIVMRALLAPRAKDRQP